MFFKNDTPLLLQLAATVSLAVAMLAGGRSMRGPIFRGKPESASQHLRLFQLPLGCWAVWALISLWAALDSSRLWRILGRPVDPLGSRALWGVLLGTLNIG